MKHTIGPKRSLAWSKLPSSFVCLVPGGFLEMAASPPRWDELRKLKPSCQCQEWGQPSILLAAGDVSRHTTYLPLSLTRAGEHQAANDHLSQS